MRGVSAEGGGAAHGGVGAAHERTGGRLGSLIAKASQGGLGSGKGDGVGVERQRTKESLGGG
jgi:hypothetical protein